MASETKLESTAPVQLLLDRAGPHATKVMLGAAVVGLIAAFLPAVTMTFKFFDSTITQALGTWQDWRGKLDLLVYLGVGVMAGLMLRRPNMSAAKTLSLACLIASGVALLLAVWLPLSVGNISKELGSLSVGIGCYLNILASLVLSAGSVLQAKRTNVF